LFTSAKETNRKKCALIYLGVTLFCAAAGAVYEHFSHGVYSTFMIFMFAVPLVGGLVPYTLLALAQDKPFPGKITQNLWNAGIATLTVGFFIQGVLEIYGTTSDLIIAYWINGVAFCAAGFTAFFVSAR
jgi:hypothetical protein